MPAKTIIKCSDINANNDCEFLGYAVRRPRTSGSDVPLTQANITSATYTVEEVGIGKKVYAEADFVVTGTGSLVVSDFVSDTLLTGSAWDKGPDGFNVYPTIPASCFPHAGRTYLVTVSLLLSGGTTHDLKWQANTAVEPSQPI